MQKVKKTKNLKRSLILFTIIPLSIDQIIKLLVVKKGFLSSYSVLCNDGIAFGISLPKGLIILINLLIISFFIFFLYHPHKFRDFNKPKARTAIFLMLAGALSNLLDRFIWGCVVDYIDLKYWPVFNLADAYITLSIFYLIFYPAYNKTKPQKKNKSLDQ